MGIAIVAAAAVLVAATVITAGLVTDALWMFELLAGVGVLLGVGVAFGLFDGATRRGADTDGDGHPQRLAQLVEDRLALLDPVEHRRLDLGAPWPTVVVGPTGVRVLTVANGAGDDAVARVAGVAAEVRGLLAGSPVEVSGLAIVPDGVATPRRGGTVTLVTLAQLPDAMARGTMVAMPVVVRTFAHLSGALAPDLRVASYSGR